MPSQFRPMLAKDGNPSNLTYPVGAQIKYDGIRASVVDGVLVSRTLKPIQNKEIQAALGRPEFNGLDGELIVGRPEAKGCMQASSSFVMSPNKTGADWTYYVFDKWDSPSNYPDRWEEARLTLYNLSGLHRPELPLNRIVMVNYLKCDTEDVLTAYEKVAVGNGHEGVIVRSLNAPYKFGRSGKTGPLLKIKRFTDFEAEVIGVYEKMHNGNVATRNALGRTERSSAKAGKVGLDTLGGFILRAVNGPWEGVEFRCGTGFNDEQRSEYWARAREWLSPDDWPFVKVKAVEIGAKDAPRFPVFLGFRHGDDL